MFDKITIQLDSKYYKNKEVVIERVGNDSGVIEQIKLNGENHKSYFISNDELVNGSKLKMILK